MKVDSCMKSIKKNLMDESNKGFVRRVRKGKTVRIGKFKEPVVNIFYN